jgi:hypothetical protein
MHLRHNPALADTKVLHDTFVQLFVRAAFGVIALRLRFVLCAKNASRQTRFAPILQESRTAMVEAHSSTASERSAGSALTRDMPATFAERELRAFLNSVTDLFGLDQTSFLTEIWLDALARMDRMPGPTSPDWRLVTVAASARLAGQLVDLHTPCALF